MIEVAHIVARVTTDLTRYNLGMTAAEARAKTMTQKMSLQGQKLTKYLSLPGAAIAYGAIKSWGDFQKNLTQIRTQAGATDVPFKVLRKNVEDLAKKSVFGPTELAKGLYHVQSVMGGGMDNMKQKMDILDQAQKLAAMGGSDLEDTTTALTAAIRTGIPGTQKMGETWKTLNGIVGSGNMRMGDLVSALGTGVLPVARLAGLTLKDVGAALTVFTDEGMGADESMTRFRTSLMMMQNPSKNAANAMKELGFSGEKLGVIIRSKGGFLNAIQYMHTRFMAFAKKTGEDMGKLIQKPGEDAQQYIARVGQTKAFALFSRAFGGSRTAGTAMLLMNQYDLLRKKYKQLSDSATHADAAYAESQKTFAAQMHRAWSNVQVALEQLGQALAPSILAITKLIAKLASGFSKLPDPAKKGIGAILLALIALGPALVIGSSLIKMFETLKTVLAALRLVAIAESGAMAMTPAGWVLLGAALLAFLLTNKKFRHAIVQIYNDVKAYWSKWVHGVVSFFKKWGPLIVAALTGPIGLMVYFIYRHFDAITNFFTKTIPQWFNAAVNLGKAIADGIKSGLGDLKGYIIGQIESAIPGGHFLGGKIGDLAHVVGIGGGNGAPKATVKTPSNHSAPAPYNFGGGKGGVTFGDVFVNNHTDANLFAGVVARKVAYR